MAETHKEVVKVWIAPDCIVCDICETGVPEVFDVQEETCVIRPEALRAEFIQPLSQAIIAAAEDCPVKVILFETIEVEGLAPVPKPGVEPVVAASTAAHSPHVTKPAKKISNDPPSPRWARLLQSAHTSGSRSGGGAAVSSRHARALPEDVAQLTTSYAPPDARDAAMIGSGFARPGDSVEDTIRRRAARRTVAADSRRRFVLALAVAWASLSGVAAMSFGAVQSFLVPKVTKEAPASFRAGRLENFATPGVYEQFAAEHCVWIVRLPDKLVALDTRCTHLGCIPRWLPADGKFKCPCHGSGYYMNGVNFEGPAPRPLERYRIKFEGDSVVVDKSKKFRQELGQWNQAESFIAM